MGLAALGQQSQAATWVTDSFTNGTVWRATGYAGLGNQNEPLACGMLTVTSSNTRPTISYELLGKAKDYVSRVTVYVRKYETVELNSAKINNKNSYPFLPEFDYRDPEEKNGAIQIAQTQDLEETSLKSEVTLDAGNYVVYVCGDIRKDVDLPYIYGGKHNYTKIGAKITAMDGVTKTTEYSSLKNSSYDDGARVLVWKLKTLYAPGDFYSKYYRIPSAVVAADGSIVASSDARKNYVRDIANNIDILMRRSTDEGKTWSTPSTIAKGTGTNEGYGDPAMAALPNGDLVCAFVHGYGLSTSSSTNLTENYYSVSKDNGVTWSTPAKIDLSEISNHRGCIAPGRMCVVKGGYLDGKVIGCFRSYKTNSEWNTTNYNFFLIFDPATRTWSCLKNSDGTNYYNNATNGTDDEAQIIQTDENTFLMSIRSGSTPCREFATITLSSATTFTASNKTFSGMTLGTAANGSMVKIDVKTAKDTYTNYIMHTVPASTNQDQESAACRSNLKIFTTPTASVSSGLTWDNSDNTFYISDPYAYSSPSMYETAQYSTVVVQEDGKIGVLYEGYPQAKRVRELMDGSEVTDYYMRTQYITLRPEDIFPNAVEDATEKLAAPTITPASKIYDVNTASDRPNPVIAQSNTVSDVTTVYTIYVYDANGNQTAATEYTTTDASTSLTWGEGALANITVSNGSYIKVCAYCTADGYKKSNTTTVSYYFKTPNRKMKIVAMPNSTSGSPQLFGDGVSANHNEEFTVTAGDKVELLGYSNAPYTFKYFTLDADGKSENLTGLNAEQDNNLGYQQTITVPTEEAVANNAGDVLVIYAYYTNPQIGLMTKAETNFYDGTKNTIETDADGNKVYVRHYFNTTWCSNGQHDSFPEEGSDYTFATDEYSVSNSVTGLKYPTTSGKTYKDVGLDLTASVMTDTSSYMNYNVIVTVYNTKTGEYVKKSSLQNKLRNTRSTDSGVAYYVINGHSYPFSIGSTVEENALGVEEGFKTTTDGTVIPALVEDLEFNQVLSTESEDADDFEVRAFLVSKNDLESVDDLISGTGNYVFQVDHTVTADATMTGIQNVTANGLTIVGKKGEVLIAAGTDAATVKVYNVVGQQVANVSLNAGQSATVALPQGVYVANGQKFIVR